MMNTDLSNTIDVYIVDYKNNNTHDCDKEYRLVGNPDSTLNNQKSARSDNATYPAVI